MKTACGRCLTVTDSDDAPDGACPHCGQRLSGAKGSQLLLGVVVAAVPLAGLLGLLLMTWASPSAKTTATESKATAAPGAAAAAIQPTPQPKVPKGSPPRPAPAPSSAKPQTITSKKLAPDEQRKWDEIRAGRTEPYLVAFWMPELGHWDSHGFQAGQQNVKPESALESLMRPPNSRQGAIAAAAMFAQGAPDHVSAIVDCFSKPEPQILGYYAMDGFGKVERRGAPSPALEADLVNYLHERQVETITAKPGERRWLGELP